MDLAIYQIFIWLGPFALWEDTEEYIDFMLATLPLSTWGIKILCYLLFYLEKWHLSSWS